MNLDDLIGTDKQIGGRLIIGKVEGRGRKYKAKCVGLPGEPCGFVNVIPQRILLAGKRLWCVGCTQRKKRKTLAHTSVGAEFASARRRRARSHAGGM